MKGISVIVCCYNSSTRLPETLKHIALQNVSPAIHWEVVVVDNASLDNTREAAMSIWSKLGSPVQFSVVDEPVAGLSAARDRGLSASRYEYLLFCDDDNWLDRNYVQLSFEMMESNDQIGALGGQFEAVCEVEPPHWFDYFAPNYTIGKQESFSGDITLTKSYVSGAGAIYRKSILLYLRDNGFKSLLSDRKGNSLSTGGDVELGYAIRMAGYRIWYDDRLKLKHFIPKERLTRKYVEGLFTGYLESLPVHLAYQQNFYPRQNYKKSWQWLILMRLLLLIPQKFLAKRKSNTEQTWITGFEFKYELKMIRSLLSKRHTYKANLNKIKHSGWNRRYNQG